jgi:hypothetical protein
MLGAAATVVQQERRPQVVRRSLLTLLVLGAIAFPSLAFSIGAPSQAAQNSLFLMNQVLVKTESGWKISSILPVPVPPLAK